MSLKLGKFTIQLNGVGVITSKVSEELLLQLKANPLFIYIPKSEPKPEAKPVEVAKKAEAVKQVAECDILEEPKPSRKRASSRSRRKSSTDKQD